MGHNISLSATKSIANKKMTSLLTGLLTATDSLPIRGEYNYELWTLQELHLIPVKIPSMC